MTMNHATAAAIEAYREVQRAEWRLEAAAADLENAMAHPELELEAYAATTMRIDQAIAEVDARDDLAASTRRQRRMVALQTGRVGR